MPAAAAVQDHLPRRPAAASLPRPRDLHAGSRPRADLRQMRRRGRHRDPAVPRRWPRAHRISPTAPPPRCARWWISTIGASTSSSPSRNGPTSSTSWVRCDARVASCQVRCARTADAPRSAAGRAAAGHAAELRELPHHARHALGALLAQRLPVRALLPDHPERCQRRGAAAVDGPPGAGGRRGVRCAAHLRRRGAVAGAPVGDAGTRCELP